MVVNYIQNYFTIPLLELLIVMQLFKNSTFFTLDFHLRMLVLSSRIDTQKTNKKSYSSLYSKVSFFSKLYVRFTLVHVLLFILCPFLTHYPFGSVAPTNFIYRPFEQVLIILCFVHFLLCYLI